MFPTIFERIKIDWFILKGKGNKMKLLVLHLSDLHFRENNNFTDDNIHCLVNAIRPSISNVECILIVVSGDLTYSGKKLQFIEIKNFLFSLKKAISLAYDISNIEFALVPGNHDVDFSTKKLGRSELEDILAKDAYKDYIGFELGKQKQFYFCAKLFNCFPDNSLIHQKEIVFGDVKILLNLLNTAVFSSLDEDQGFHYLLDDDISALEKQGDVDYVFTVMHHPHSWFNSHVTDKLEAAIYRKSDLILVGHKHYENTRTVTENQNSVNVMAGGMLSNCGDWDTSEFHIGVLDTETREFRIKTYHWEKAEKVYIEKGEHNTKLSKDRYNPLGISALAEYLDLNINQDRFMIANSFLDYFVFPLLEEIKDEASEKNVLLSTHAIAMKGALEYLTPGSGGSYWAKNIGNCDIYAADVIDGSYTVPVLVDDGKDRWEGAAAK